MKPAARRWGPIATLAWSIALAAVFFIAQGVLLVAFIEATAHGAAGAALEREVLRLQSNGDVLAVASLLTIPVCTVILFAIVKLRRGATLADTLALGVPPARTVARWLIAMLALAAVADLVTLAIGKPVVPEFMEQAWASARGKAALVAALLVAAPLFEELFFRGFVLSGFEATRLPPMAPIALSAAAWAMVHTQYDLYGILVIFAMGILLGMARVATGSVLVPIAMHALANAWAVAETALAAAAS